MKFMIFVGKLKWGIVHTDKFWESNANRFSDEVIKDIIKLTDMTKNDPETRAVACYDLG
jgi:V-type H+-transporting ATPase subunit H